MRGFILKVILNLIICQNHMSEQQNNNVINGNYSFGKPQLTKFMKDCLKESFPVKYPLTLIYLLAF